MISTDGDCGIQILMEAILACLPARSTELMTGLGGKIVWTTVLSGAEERGVDGLSLDRSYFSQLQPISFLFFNPSSSHVG